MVHVSLPQNASNIQPSCCDLHFTPGYEIIMRDYVALRHTTQTLTATVLSKWLGGVTRRHLRQVLLLLLEFAFFFFFHQINKVLDAGY